MFPGIELSGHRSVKITTCLVSVPGTYGLVVETTTVKDGEFIVFVIVRIML